MLNDRLDLGLMFSFRNPAAWRRPFTDVYRDELDLIVDAEAMGGRQTRCARRGGTRLHLLLSTS
jgi:hypothetical protein